MSGWASRNARRCAVGRRLPGTRCPAAESRGGRAGTMAGRSPPQQTVTSPPAASVRQAPTRCRLAAGVPVGQRQASPGTVVHRDGPVRRRQWRAARDPRCRPPPSRARPAPAAAAGPHGGRCSPPRTLPASAPMRRQSRGARAPGGRPSFLQGQILRDLSSSQVQGPGPAGLARLGVIAHPWVR
jgi:hypothetical protein